MNEDVLAQNAPSAVIGALLILKIVFDFVKDKGKVSHDEISKQIYQAESIIVEAVRKVKDDIDLYQHACDKAMHDLAWLKEVHERTDEDGVFLWYNRRSLERKIENLTDTMGVVSNNLNELVTKLKDEKQRSL